MNTLPALPQPPGNKHWRLTSDELLASSACGLATGGCAGFIASLCCGLSSGTLVTAFGFSCCIACNLDAEANKSRHMMVEYQRERYEYDKKLRNFLITQQPGSCSRN